MSEESGLTEATDLDSVVLDIQQIPVAAWIFPLVGVLFGGFFVGMLVPSLMVFWVVLFLAFLVALIAGSALTRPMRIEISPTELSVQGWIGTLPRPDTVSVPVLGTTLSWKAGALVNDVQVYVVRVLRDGEVVATIPSLRCKDSELAEVRERLEGMQALAEALHGEGADEVPDDLERMIRARRAQSETAR